MLGRWWWDAIVVTSDEGEYINTIQYSTVQHSTVMTSDEGSVYQYNTGYWLLINSRIKCQHRCHRNHSHSAPLDTRPAADTTVYLSSHVSIFSKLNYNLQNMSKINSQSLYRVMLHINIQISGCWVMSTPDSSSAAGLNASHPHHRVE